MKEENNSNLTTTVADMGYSGVKPGRTGGGTGDLITWFAPDAEADGNRIWDRDTLMGSMINMNNTHGSEASLLAMMVEEYSRLMWISRPVLTEMEASYVVGVLRGVMLFGSLPLDPRTMLFMELSDAVDCGKYDDLEDSYKAAAHDLAERIARMSLPEAMSIVHSAQLVLVCKFPIEKAFKILES